MKRFKITDAWISFILIPGFALVSAIKHDMNYVLAGYFTVGGWQLASMIVHFMNHWFLEKGSMRVIYHRIVIVILIIAALGLIFPIILYFLLFIMLFAAPFLAIYYTWICYFEIRIKMQRPIAMLK